MDLACHRRPLITGSETRLPLRTKWLCFDFRHVSRPDVTFQLLPSDSFRFSLLNSRSLLLSSETLLDRRNTFASSRSTPQCADCLVVAVVHYNLSSIVGAATYTSYPATCAGTTCLYLHESRLLEVPRAFHCLTTKRGGNKGGSMAFFARGREESRCVLVWLGKSEVTALTHR